MNTNMRYIMNNFWKHIFAISGGEQSRTARYWKFILIFIFAFSLLTAVGCNNNQINMWSGAGVDPDLDAPVITITSPDNMATVGSVFMLTGTATDNVGVTSVEIQGLKTGLIKVSNIKNGKWKYTINNDLPSGAYTITVTAKDKAGNKSNTSTKTIAIIVDASSPIANINYPPLLTINELSALDYRDYGDIDFFQNKQFNIRGSVDDDYPLKDVTVIMTKEHDNTEDVVYKFRFDEDYLSDKSHTDVSGSLYNWNITIDSTNDVSNDYCLNRLGRLSATEIHYLKVNVIVHDKAGNEGISYSKDNNYLCLYQEADRPWNVISSMTTALSEEQQEELQSETNADKKQKLLISMQQSNNKLHSAAPISAIAYDDDGLSQIEYKIIKTSSDEIIRYGKITSETFGSSKAASWQAIAPSITGNYQLYHRIIDMNGIPSYSSDTALWTETNGWSTKYSIGFQVIDESAPTTEITPIDDYPATAYIGSEDPHILVEGTTKDGAGLTAIMLAWDPSADTDNSIMLKTTQWNVTESGWADGTSDTKIRYWVIDMTTVSQTVRNSTYTTKWSYKIPLSDFTLENGQPIYGPRRMYYCAVSLAGTFGSGTFSIPRDYNSPTLTITSPSNGDTCRNVGNDRFHIVGKVTDIESGIASASIKYYDKEGAARYYDLSSDEIADNGEWNISSDKLEGLSGGYQKLTITAADRFGNITADSVSVKVDDDSPTVSSISADESADYYSTGKELHFTVTMSRKVTVTSSQGHDDDIRLYLNCNNNAYAEYVGIDDSQVLKFTYQIKDGDEADPLDYTSTTSLVTGEYTTVSGKVEGNNESTVEASLLLPAEPGDSGSLASRGITIDTNKPIIKSFTTNVGEGAYNAGTEITITAEFNENISGQVKIRLNTDTELTSAEANNSDSLEFIYTVAAGDTASLLDILSMVSLSDSITIKDRAGNIANMAAIPKGNTAGSLAQRKICIDTTSPKLNKLAVRSLTGKEHGSKYYLNESKTFRIAAEFSEPMQLGSISPTLTLNAKNGGDYITANYIGEESSSKLLFEYTVKKDDNSPTATPLSVISLNGDITDAAKNAIAGSSANVTAVNKELTYNSSQIFIDTTAPAAATMIFKNEYTDLSSTFNHSGNTYTGRANGYTTDITVDVSGEADTIIRMNVICGGETKLAWTDTDTRTYTTETSNAEQTWTIKVQPEDYAGNKADVTTAVFTVDNGIPKLTKILTAKSSGTYKIGDVIDVKLVFSKPVKNAAAAVLTFSNDAAVTFDTTNDYATTYTGKYIVGTDDKDSLTSGIRVASIIGGSFSDKTGNLVAPAGNYELSSVSNDFTAKTIKIDRTKPKVTGYTVSDMSDKNYTDENSYYLNADDTVTIAVTYDEAVKGLGTSALALSNGAAAVYKEPSQDNKTLYYIYTITPGKDSAAGISVQSNPTNVTDLAGNAAEAAMPSEKTLRYSGKTLIIDTTKPQPPTVAVQKTNGDNVASGTMNVTEQCNLIITAYASDTCSLIEYSIDSGASTAPYTNQVLLGENGGKKSYYIMARQTDKAGNKSSFTAKHTVEINLQEMGISKITTTKENGKYTVGNKIPIILMFTQKVKLTGVTLKLNVGSNITTATYSSDTAALSHTIEYTIAAGHNCDRLSVTSISGTFTDESSANVDTKIQTSFTKLSDNFKDNAICIDTTAPTLTGVTISDITDSSGTPHIKNSKYYLNDGDTVTMNITFSEPVVPVGTSEVLLNSSEKATCISSGLNSTHTYRYTVRNGNTSSLGLSNTVVSEVQDEAGNRLTAAYTQADMQFAGKTIVVDTTLPAEPVFTIVDQSSQTVANNSSKSEKLSLTISGEAEADIQYSVNGGASYQSYTGAVTLGVDKAQTLYKITAKQTDPAGNEKTTPSVFTVTVDLRVVGLKGVTTTKMGGTYKSGEKIPLTIEFYKAVTVSNGKLTLDNGAEVPFSDVSGKTSVTVTYTVGAAASFSTDRLYAKSIRGTFKDTATNSLVTSFDNVSGSITSGAVDGTIAASAENLPTDSANKIIIDTVAPTMQSAALTDISDKGHLDGNYYLNAGDTVTMTLTMNDAVIVRGSSSLTLSNGGSAVYSAISDDKMTLTYIYTVSSSDTNAASLSIPAGAYPNNVTDMAGNELSSGLAAAQVLRYGGKDLIIDTQCAAPTVTVTNADGSVISGSGTNRQIKITVTGAADKASSEYSLDAGASYTPYTAAVTVGEAGELKTYKILARQTDKAGNLSPASASQTITVDMRTMGLKSISTTKMGGVYKAGEIIPIVLEFNKATTVTDGSLTLNNGASVSFSCTNKTSCTANYQIGPSDTSIAALQVTNFTGTIKDPSVGNAFVTSFDNVGGSVSNGAVSGAIGSITNLPSSGVNAVGVDTIAPTIAASGIAFSASTGVSRGGKYYCKAGTTVTISIEMSEEVTVTGSSQVALSNGAKASYDSISNDKKTLYYVYTVATGDTNTDALKVNASIYPNNVTDQAGNLLSSGLGSASNISNVIIDTQCKMPTMTLSPDIADKGSTDNTVTLTFSNNGESNAVIRYSTDGGSSYSQYSTAVTLGISGQKNTYQIMAYQTDIAGNQSSSTTMRTLTVDMRVLKLSSITTTKVAGTYKAGEVIPLTLTFSKNVTVTGGKLTLNTGKTVSFTCTNASTVTTSYTVQAGDNVNPLKATGITAGTIQDVDAGNVTADNAVIYSKMLLRDNIPTNIKLDTTAPTVTGYTVTATSAAAANKSGSVYYLNAGKTLTISMTAGEPVNVTGSSVLTLSNGGKAVYSSGSGTAALTYIYTVGSSDTNEALSVDAGAKPTFVTDAAGNELTSSQSAIILKDSSSNTFTVDTVCNAPTMSGITAGEVYKTAQPVTVSGTETGASLRYSADGGATNTTFTGTSFTPALSGDGTYQITVQQTDIAGNTSVWRSPIQIIFDAVAPTIKSISTTKASGTYGIGEKLEITAEFSEAVSGSITVKLNTNATVTLSPSSATTASATYTVASGQNANTLQVSTVTGTITDVAGNSSTTSHSGYTNFSGKTIRIDTTAPALSTYKVYKYGGTQTSSVSKTTLTQDVDSTKPITLTFDENVIKGSGTIKIERVYKSYPAVLSADDWQSISDAEVKGLYIQRCIGTVGNDDVTPDTNAKYVLKYEIDHKAWDTTPSGDAGKVYNYFADKDYNVMTLDITSGLISVSGQSVTITPSSALAVGITYQVVVSAGALIDAAGNSCAADSSVQFETGPTATPVIRIDKKSGLESGSQPQSVGVKISTETFGGTIYYQSKCKETASNTEVITVSDVTNPTPANTSSTDQYTASLSNTTTSAAIFKLYAKTVKSGLSQGTTAKELAFKTIVYNDSAYGFRGSDSTGGVSATTEFPLSWYGTPTSARCDSNRLYSWHILKNFQFKTMSGENTYQNDGDANSLGYVGCLNKANVSHGGGGGGSSVTLTFTNNYNWSPVYAYFFDSNAVGAAWPGTTMTYSYKNDMNQDVYTITVPDGATKVIFNNNSGSQTVNINLTGTDTRYYISGGSGTSHTVATW